MTKKSVSSRSTMLIDKINADERLYGHTRLTCDENNICIEICPELLHNGFLSDRIAIVKPDSFYNAQHVSHKPPSVDCIVIVRCSNDKYDVYLIELRHAGTKNRRLKAKTIQKKFIYTVKDFILSQFVEIFSCLSGRINRLNLWIVTDAMNSLRITEHEYKKKIVGTVLDQYNNLKPIQLFGIMSHIEVKACTSDVPIHVIPIC